MKSTNNTLIFKMNTAFVYNKDIVDSFLSYKNTCGVTIKTLEGYHFPSSKVAHPVITRGEEAGKWYHKFLKDGIILHVRGLSIQLFDHAIKLPISWYNTVIETKPITTTDEYGNPVESTEDITNGIKYAVNIESRTNETHCLVKIDDVCLEYFTTLIEYDVNNIPTNLYCSDAYNEEVALNFTPLIEPDENI